MAASLLSILAFSRVIVVFGPRSFYMSVAESEEKEKHVGVYSPLF